MGGHPLASDQFGYDANLRPTSTSATWQSGSGSSGSLFSQNLSFDPASNVISRATTQAAVPGVSGSGGSESQNFCYDEQNRLVWAGNSGNQPGAGNGTCGSATLSNSLSGASYTNTFVYTHLGQLWQGPLNGTGSQQQYLYCNTQPHELTGLYGSSATCSTKTGQAYTSSYDSWGNVTSRTSSGTTATLTYDQLDHFVSWNAGSTNKELYVYDASGTRVLRRTTNTSGTSMVIYAFGLEEHSYYATGVHRADLYYYTLGGRLLGALDNNGKTSFYLTDTLGSVFASFNNVDNSAALKGNQVFGPYGNNRDMQGTINTAKGFTGQYSDNLTGLDYYQSRYYDQVAGVFLSADTMQGNLQGMNPYSYVGSNPETKNDPTGHYVAGPNGEAYYPGSPYYTQGGKAFSVQTGHAYSGNGFANGWRDGQGPNAPSSHTGSTPPKPIPNKSAPVVHQSSNSPWDWLTNLWHNLTGPPPPGEVNSILPSMCGTTLSFAAKTKIATSRGKKSISSLHPNEQVWAYNPKTHTMELEPVVHIWINHDHELENVTIASTMPAHHSNAAQKTSEVVHTNQRHPFLTVERGFIPVSQLRVGMHVMKATGGVGTITMLKVIPGTMTMYNLEIAQDHTYTVGEGEWIVHNCGVGPVDGSEDPTNDITMQDILNNPQLLKNLSNQQVEQIVARDGGWVTGPLRKTNLPGETFNQLNSRGTAFTDKYIQWHFGEGRHGPNPIWKVSTNKGIEHIDYEGPITTAGDTTGGDFTEGDIPDFIDP